MRKILLAALLLAGLTGCIPNDPDLIWSGVNENDREIRIPQEELLQRPWLWDDIEAWCIVSFGQGGDGDLFQTDFRDALSRSDASCGPDGEYADRLWHADRERGW